MENERRRGMSEEREYYLEMCYECDCKGQNYYYNEETGVMESECESCWINECISTCCC